MANGGLIPWLKGERSPGGRDPFMALHEQMDDLLESFMGRSQAGGGRFWPSVDVKETDGEVTMTTELPGMEEKDIDASIANDVLTLKGEKKQEKEEKGEESYRLERTYGSFRREIPLPCAVDGDKAKATFSKGVLTVTVPKAAPRKERKRIEVKPA